VTLHEQIVLRLQALVPETLELEDESSQHAGHEGSAGGGGHYHLTIVSGRFAGLNAIARHRLVYGTLGDLMAGPVHALAIVALSPEELS
jgi:BolA family transcriptional regulator, general stress-responsive regulator